MNLTAVERAIRKIGWMVQPRDYEGTVAQARATIADSSSSPARIEVAREIVAAADGAESPALPSGSRTEQQREAQRERDAAKETDRIERQRSGSAAAGEEKDEPILGLLADGTPMTAGACQAQSVDPISYLQTEGAKIGRAHV